MHPAAPKKILITDTTLRDAHQSLIATRLRTEDMLPLAREIDHCGFFRLKPGVALPSIPAYGF